MQQRLWTGLGLLTVICATLLLAGCEDDSSSSAPQQAWSLHAGRWVGTGQVGGLQRTITIDISSENGTVTIDDPGGNVDSLPWNSEHKWDLGQYKGLTFTSPTEGTYVYHADTIALHKE